MSVDAEPTTTRSSNSTTTNGAGDAVPHGVADPVRIPVERYFSREFAELEKEKLWMTVWQMACRLEDIPRPGDFIEYEIVGESVLVVRQDDGSARAFHNACRHRATALGEGSGTFHGGQIVCPYHGWRWNLDGANSYVYARSGFDKSCLDSAALRLRECRTATAFGCVFVTFDPEAPPLEVALGDIISALEPIGFDRMRVRWWRHVVLPANWKMAQEAFMEAYHVMQAHPSLSMGAADDDYDLEMLSDGFECFDSGSGHGLPPTKGGVPVAGMSAAEYFIQFNNALYVGTDAYATERDMFVQQGLMEADIPDEQFPLAFMQALAEYAKGAGIPLPPPSMTTSGYAHIFPNITVLPAYGNSIIYRVRPYKEDPEQCVFEVWAVTIPPEGEHPDRPELEGPIPPADWPQIFKEDFDNVAKQQKGLHTRGMDELIMADGYEAMIVNSHHRIDELLARP
jgi:phenylpropionate dioxygenase-like ring-hydroxylating dioxygenase large terminal subunit